MVNLFISIFGSLIADRILSRLENFRYISSKVRLNIMITTTIFSLFSLVFKDLYYFNYILIGMFLIFLMFFYVFHEKKLISVFENRQKSLIDELIIHLKSGKSPSFAVAEVYFRMSKVEKKVFIPLQAYFDVQIDDSKMNSHFICPEFFCELKKILLQKAKVIEQLDSFRKSLSLIINLRRKSRAVSSSARAQVCVAIGVYLVFFMISCLHFQLLDFPGLIFASTMLFCIGAYIIFKLGDKIKWSI